jgi:hypothetical protein
LLSPEACFLFVCLLAWRLVACTQSNRRLCEELHEYQLFFGLSFFADRHKLVSRARQPVLWVHQGIGGSLVCTSCIGRASGLLV